MLLFPYHYYDPTLWLLFLGVILAASSTAVIGTFSLLQKEGLAADAIAHALLPGICLSFMITHRKEPWLLTVGALASGGLALLLLHTLARYAKIKRENAIAVVLSIFVGTGLMLLSYIQHSGYESQAGLHHFLLGNIASLMQRDIWFFALLDLAIFVCLILLFKEWQLLSFDRQFAQAIGRPVKRLTLVFQFLTLMAIIMGVQTVGIVLMSAMLLIPAAAARSWTNRLSKLVWIAIFFSCLASLLGVLFSSMLAIPTGPCMVLLMNLIAFFSFIVAPADGWLARMYRQHCYRKKIWKENILKLLYQLSKKNNAYQNAYTVSQLFQARPLDQGTMRFYLQKLAREGLVLQDDQGRWALTPLGFKKGEHVRRLHVLWQTYLGHYMGVEKSHAHNEAEAIEHLITPKIKKKLDWLVANQLEQK
ncbi:MAG: iron chelate uptake ABC transporter family permease subunit [Bacteroidota bacterium]